MTANVNSDLYPHTDKIPPTNHRQPGEGRAAVFESTVYCLLPYLTLFILTINIEEQDAGGYPPEDLNPQS